MLHDCEDMALLFHVLISYLLRIRGHYAISAIFEYYYSCCILHSPNILASWYRGPNGVLTRGALVHEKHCPCCFEIYYPYDLKKCPKILSSVAALIPILTLLLPRHQNRLFGVFTWYWILWVGDWQMQHQGGSFWIQPSWNFYEIFCHGQRTAIAILH